MHSPHRDHLWLGLAFVVLGAACTGGQSSDDGALLPDAGPPGGGPDSGPPGPDGGGTEFTIVVERMLDGESTQGCASGVDPELAQSDLVAALQAAPNFCEGNEGTWSCSCEGETSRSFAATCVGALLERCGVEAEPLLGRPAPAPTDCETSLASRAGSCQLQENGGYACRCGAPVGQAREVDAESCEAALWATCAAECGDTSGSCEPIAVEPPGLYRCLSPANGLTREVWAAGCANALLSATDLTYEGDGCTGYGGYCERAGADSLRCTCSDGSMQDAELDPTLSYGACHSALEATCGPGAPPDGATCELTRNGYTAHCARAAAQDAPFMCRCFVGGKHDQLVGGDSLAATTCEAALAQVCPYTEPLTEEDRRVTCDYYADCDTRYVGFSVDTCLADAPDACVACTAEFVGRAEMQDGGCPGVSCDTACEELVPRDVAIAACEASLEQRDALDPQGRCMCDRCYPWFGRCVADDGCVELIECARSQGCRGAACVSDPVCGPIITREPRGTQLALALDSCDATDDCAAITEP